jgi:multidrug transporter EmrE-like cation transporter
MGYLYIGLTILFTVYGQLIIKYEVNRVFGIAEGITSLPFLLKFIFTRPLVLSGFASAFLASLAWVGAVSKFEMSYAYPFMSLNFVLVVLLSFYAFNESINAYKIFGLLLICIGVAVLSKGL